MFNNVGGKLKDYAEVICWLGIILSIIGMIVLFSIAMQIPANQGRGTLIFGGIVVGIAGYFISWISSLGIYAFGQMVENTDEICSRLSEIKAMPSIPSQVATPRFENIIQEKPVEKTETIAMKVEVYEPEAPVDFADACRSALKWESTDGMRRYLRQAARMLNEDDAKNIEKLLALSDNSLRAGIEWALEARG